MTETDAKSTPQSIYVYRLVDPKLIADRQDEIAKALFGMESATDGNRSLYVSPISGCISYADYDQIWQNTDAGSLPKTADEAQQAALEFLQGAAKKSIGDNKDHLPPLFPEDIRPIGTVAAFAPGKESADHWLSQFMVFLPIGGIQTPGADTTDSHQPSVGSTPVLASAPSTVSPASPSAIPSPSSPESPASPASPSTPTIAAAEPAAPVDGGIIDVRIGASGKIVALRSCWRPFHQKEVTSVKRLSPPHESTHDEHGAEEGTILCYQLGGDEEPQTFIAPYYVTFTDHGQVVAPASSYSPVVRIAEEQAAQGVTLAAEVEGTLGPINYAWGAERLDSRDESAFVQLGSGRSVSLGPGVHDIAIDVQDKRTGAICRRGAIVYVASRRAEQ